MDIEERVKKVEEEIKTHKSYFDFVANGINASARCEFKKLEQSCSKNENRLDSLEEDIDFVADEIIDICEKQENLQKQVDELLEKEKSRAKKEKEFYLFSTGIYAGLLIALVIFLLTKII